MMDVETKIKETKEKISSDFKISETTGNFLKLKSELNDLYDKIVYAYTSMYSEMPDDEFSKVGDALRQLHDIVDVYIMNSINDNFGCRGNKCII